MVERLESIQNLTYREMPEGVERKPSVMGSLATKEAETRYEE
jgi:hypothetical protein